MIDNLKFFVTDKIEWENRVMQTQCVHLNGRFHFHTGHALEYPKTGRYNNLNVCITDKRAYLVGSFHKFKNIWLYDKYHNYDDFTFDQYNEVKNMVCKSLYIQSKKTKLTNIEFGFNLSVNEDPQQIIDRILMYDFNAPSRNLTFKGKGDYKEFITSDFSFKIYNKSKQNGLKDNILRIEMKMTRSRFFNKLGIYNLDDIKATNLKNLFEVFLAYFDKLFIIDNLSLLKDLKKLNSDLVRDGLNPNYWLNIKRNDTRNIKAKQKAKFKKSVIDIYSFETKKYLRSLLQLKFDELLYCKNSLSTREAI